jgi:AcrR family transcriptional regulator
MTNTAALPRREANKAKIRSAILEAAIAKFGEKTINSTTMDEIAEQAKVSRATLFNYFPGKAEIVAGIVQQMDEAFIAQMDRFAQYDMPLAKRVEEFFRAHARDLETRWLRFRPLVGNSEQGWGEDGGAPRLARSNEAFLRLVRDAPEEDRRTIAEVLHGAYIGIVHNWRFESGYPLEDRLVAAARLVMCPFQ